MTYNPPTNARLNGVLFFAGSCNPNPGPHARYGFVLVYGNGRRLEEDDFVGDGTNNSAELHGLVAGLETADDVGVTHLEIYGCSTVALNSIRLEREFKSAGPLADLRSRARELCRRFVEVDAYRITREENAESRALARQIEVKSL